MLCMSVCLSVGPTVKLGGGQRRETFPVASAAPLPIQPCHASGHTQTWQQTQWVQQYLIVLLVYLKLNKVTFTTKCILPNVITYIQWFKVWMFTTHMSPSGLDLKPLDGSRPGPRLPDSPAPPCSQQDNKIKQEPKTPIAPKKTQVCPIVK